MSKRYISAMIDFLSPLSVVKGIGEKRLAVLKENGLENIGDLLYYLPLRYLDRSNIIPIAEAGNFLNRYCTIKGRVERIQIEKGRKSRLRILLCDNTGSIELLWFNGIGHYSKSINRGEILLVTGIVSRFTSFQMVHPLIEKIRVTEDNNYIPILPLYRLTSEMLGAGINQTFLRKTIIWILKNCKHYPEFLSTAFKKKYDLLPLEKSIKELHFPESLKNIEIYKKRIQIEKLFSIATSLIVNRKKFQKEGRALSAGKLKDLVLNNLPFNLTDDQQKAIEVLLKDCSSSKKMHRLLQGDVGCGKTVVAFFATLPSINEGLQVVWMTPTEVLARQTWEKVNKLLMPHGLNADLLTSTTRSIELYERIRNGITKFIIGTHALIQSGVSFDKVGIFIIDEQHRFGVKQRLLLQEKDEKADFLMISATPIPQTLAKTLYGDLDILTIKSIPPGRQKISSHLVPEEKRFEMEKFIREQILKGGRCYYIVPKIEKDPVEENDDDIELRDVESTFSYLTKGIFNDIPAGFLHGKMPSLTKEKTIDDFINGKISLLVATTVVEVGIDVPEATIIVIENAERFGLSQLHQLRGRVGRGKEKSYCFLLHGKNCDKNTKEKLQKFCSNYDGFKIAEMDLHYRGPGELTGYKQSGWNDIVSEEIIKNPELFIEILSDVEKYFFN